MTTTPPLPTQAQSSRHWPKTASSFASSATRPTSADAIRSCRTLVSSRQRCLGYDIEALLKAAGDVDMDEAVELGVQMAEAAQEGRDKVTVVVPPGRFSTFGLWIEQLIAESLGKQGRGCIPVPTTEPETG